MKTKRIFLIWLVAGVFSCAVECGIDDNNTHNPGGGGTHNPGGNGTNNPGGGGNGPRVGETKTFWILNEDDRFEQVNAVLRSEGKYSTFWVQANFKYDQSTLDRLVAEYDDKIRPAVLNAFAMQGPITDPDTGKVVAQNSLEWADYLGDGDGKLAVLLVDLGSGDLVTLGYFHGADFYAKADPRHQDYKYSNEADIVYMNIHLMNKPEPFNETLAHEAQHLINFVNSALLRRFLDEDYDMWDWHRMDRWINEGLSSAAEYVYSGKHSEHHLHWYKDNSQSDKVRRIPFGNNFFIWGEHPNAIMDEYATVYLFFQWLRLQAGGGNKIYQDIGVSPEFDYKAVVKALQGKGNYADENNLQWGTLLRDWMLSNFMASSANAPPRHSYMKDPLLSTIGVTTLYGGDQIQLLPGEGVYSITRSAGTNYASSGNIRYACADYSNGVINNGTSIKDGFLLTYNINTQRTGALGNLLETGRTSPDKSMAPSNAPRENMDAEPISRPPTLYGISLWDMISLRKHQKQMKAQGLEVPVFKNAQSLRPLEN